MGQIVEVPGQGRVEFPDGMSDEQIVAAIKKNSMSAPAQAIKPSVSGFMAENRARNEALFKGGWGTGYPQLAYDVGGGVTDVTGSPSAGGVANFLMNAIPTFLTGGKITGPGPNQLPPPPSSLSEGFSEWLMRKAVRPGKAARESGDAAKAMKTMLEETIYPTPSGMEKAGRIASKMEPKIIGPIEKSAATAKVSDITAPVAEVMRKAERQFVPQADVAAVEDVWTKALQNPLLQGKTEIPVKLAHELKKGTYQALGGKAYGEVGSTAIEAQKALARGAREAVAKAVPEVADPLARQASMMNVMDVAADRALLEGNKNLLSLAPIASHPLAAMSFLADRWAALKAFLALQAYHGAKPQVLTPLGLSISAAQQTDPALLQNQAGALYQGTRGLIPPFSAVSE